MALMPRGSTCVQEEEVVVINSDSCSEDDAESSPQLKIVKIEPEVEVLMSHK